MKIRNNSKSRMSLWGIGPVYVGLSAAVALLCFIADHVLRLPVFSGVFSIVLIVLGSLLIPAGFGIWYLAARGIKSYIRTGRLADDGIYSVVRNPIYSGILIAFSGICLILHRPLMLLPPVFAYCILRMLLKKEERVMEECFGEQYRIYKVNTNAVIPSAGPLIRLLLGRLSKQQP